MYICVCVSCPTTDPDGPRRVYVTGNRSSVHVFFLSPMRESTIDDTGVSCVNVWNHCVYTSSSTPIARMHSFVRACAWARDDGNGWMDGCVAFVHSRRLSSTREETDGLERRTERDHRHRSHRTRLSRVSPALSLSLSNDEFIHSLIHSVANERTNERRDERTNERPDALERDARERRTRSTRSFASNSARARRGTRVCLERTTHRTHRIARAF